MFGPRFQPNIYLTAEGGDNVPTIDTDTTVLIPTDFPNLVAALTYAQGFIYLNGAILTIEHETGYIATGDHDFQNVVLPNVRIKYASPTQLDGNTVSFGHLIFDESTQLNAAYGEIEVINSDAQVVLDLGSTVSYTPQLIVEPMLKVSSTGAGVDASMTLRNKMFTEPLRIGGRVALSATDSRLLISQDGAIESLSLSLSGGFLTDTVAGINADTITMLGDSARISLRNTVCDDITAILSGGSHWDQSGITVNNSANYNLALSTLEINGTQNVDDFNLSLNNSNYEQQDLTCAVFDAVYQGKIDARFDGTTINSAAASMRLHRAAVSAVSGTMSGDFTLNSSASTVFEFYDATLQLTNLTCNAPVTVNSGTLDNKWPTQANYVSPDGDNVFIDNTLTTEQTINGGGTVTINDNVTQVNVLANPTDIDLGVNNNFSSAEITFTNTGAVSITLAFNVSQTIQGVIPLLVAGAAFKLRKIGATLWQVI